MLPKVFCVRESEEVMTAQRFMKAILVVSALMLAMPVEGQMTVSTADIQRLQDEVYQASTDISRLRSADASTVTRLQEELDELRDEVTYLKVKLRKDGTVSRAEYSELRDRLQDLRSRARGEESGTRRGSYGGGVSGGVPGGVAGGVPGGVSGGAGGDRRTRTGDSAIPVGQEIDARLQQELSSDNAQVEDRFETTTVVDLSQGNRVLIPAGSVMRGIISSVDRASRTDRRGSLTVSFDQVTVDGRNYPMRGTVTQALESEGIRGEAARIGAGSAVGAIIGGIIGGVKGALLGVLIGGGGTIAATEGKDVTLPAGTILRVRLDTPPNIR
jgi:TolA-binding protein